MSQLENTPCSLVALVPCLNEADGVGPTIEEIKDVIHDQPIVVVDGNSSDGTPDVASKLGALVINQRSKGKGNAVREGLEYIRNDSRLRSCKYLLIIDGDRTYPCDKVPEMLQILSSNPKVGMVIGKRARLYSVWKLYGLLMIVGNLTFAFLHSLLNKVRLTDPLSGLRLISFEVIKRWNPMSGGFELEVELNRYVFERGYKIEEVPVVYRKRRGAKKLRIHHALWILKKIVTMELTSR